MNLQHLKNSNIRQKNIVQSIDVVDPNLSPIGVRLIQSRTSVRVCAVAIGPNIVH